MYLHNDHNVYIPGAGFSADRGMPPISNFMFRMRDAHEWLVQWNRNVEGKAIREELAELWPNHDMAFYRTLKQFPEFHE